MFNNKMRCMMGWKYTVFPLFSAMILSSCATNATLSTSLLSKPETFSERTGVVGVVKVNGESPCKTTGTITLVDENDDAYEIDFYPNTMFGAELHPGKFRVRSAEYKCTVTDAANQYYVHRTTYSFKNVEGDGSLDKTWTVPRNGFCKALVPKGFNDGVLAQAAANLPKGIFATKHPTLGTDIDEMDYCSGGSPFHKSVPQVIRKSGAGSVEDFEGDESGILWNALNEGGNQGVSQVSGKVVSSKSGNHYYSLKYTLSNRKNSSVRLLSFKENAGLGGCKAISYDYKGPAHSFFLGASVNGEVYMTESIHLNKSKDGWRTVKIEMDELRSLQINFDKFMDNFTSFVWQVYGEGGERGELLVDNIYCE